MPSMEIINEVIEIPKDIARTIHYHFDNTSTFRIVLSKNRLWWNATLDNGQPLQVGQEYKMFDLYDSQVFTKWEEARKYIISDILCIKDETILPIEWNSLDRFCNLE